jgi:hypothetical protein
MSGAILPLPQYSLMAWCSVTSQGQLYLYRRLVMWWHFLHNWYISYAAVTLYFWNWLVEFLSRSVQWLSRHDGLFLNQGTGFPSHQIYFLCVTCVDCTAVTLFCWSETLGYPFTRLGFSRIWCCQILELDDRTVSTSDISMTWFIATDNHIVSILDVMFYQWWLDCTENV